MSAPSPRSRSLIPDAYDQSSTEQFIVAALRAANALTVSLVAELNGRVVGRVACSPAIISDGSQNWYGLGPVSVAPEYQRQGIGTALIREAISILKGLQARGCCLVGDPEYLLQAVRLQKNSRAHP